MTVTPEYGHGAHGMPPVVPPISVLKFEVEFLEISRHCSGLELVRY